jgi:hypothetical protein
VLPSPPGPETADVEADWSPRGNQLLFERFIFGGPVTTQPSRFDALSTAFFYWRPHESLHRNPRAGWIPRGHTM